MCGEPRLFAPPEPGEAAGELIRCRRVAGVYQRRPLERRGRVGELAPPAPDGKPRQGDAEPRGDRLGAARRLDRAVDDINPDARFAAPVGPAARGHAAEHTRALARLPRGLGYVLQAVRI